MNEIHRNCKHEYKNQIMKLKAKTIKRIKIKKFLDTSTDFIRSIMA